MIAKKNPSLRDLSRTVLCVSQAFIIAIFFECFVTALSQESETGFLFVVQLWLYLVPIYAFYSLSAALGFFFVARAFGSRIKAGHGMEAGVLLIQASVFVLLTYNVFLFSFSHFHNMRLSAMLVTGCCVVILIILSGIKPSIALLLKQITKRNRKLKVSVAANLIGASCAVAVFSWLCFHNRHGFAQLNIFTWLIPLVTVIALGCSFVLSKKFFSARLKRLYGLILTGLLIIGTISFITIESLSLEIVNIVATRSPVSRYLAMAVQGLTDFDGDGHSSLMGGMDCAPFNGEIAPGKKEIPGDGIDNNCVGADNSVASAVKPPEWYELPEGWPELSAIVITVEALRSDHLGFMGYEKRTTPNLKKLAEKSTVFQRFYSSSVYTRIALPSLFTSRLPLEIVWKARKKSSLPTIAPKNPWFPSALKKQGVKTGAFLVDFSAFTSKENFGFNRGFDTYDISTKLKYKGGTMRGFPSQEQVQKAIVWIKENGKRRFFLWLHLVEPHYAYEKYPGSPNFGSGQIGRYDSEIWGADKQIGKLLNSLEQEKLLNSTVVFITGDHAEAFEEHGARFHGKYLYDTQTRTGGLLWVPGVKPGKIEQVASHHDIIPTLSNLMQNRNSFKDYTGRNFTPAFFGKAVTERPTILEKWSIQSRLWYHIALVSWPYKLFSKGNKFFLFNLETDPGEKTDKSKTDKAVFKKMKKQMEEYSERVELDYK